MKRAAVSDSRSLAFQARNAVKWLFHSGQIPHPNVLPCRACGIIWNGKGSHEYHHHKGYDPEHQLDVVPMCRRCHNGLEGIVIETLPVPLPTTDLAEARSRTAEFIKARRSEATRRAYAADWRDFEAWCARNSFCALPAIPENVAVYLSSLAMAGRKASTIERRCSAIANYHHAAGHENPAAHTGVRATLEGITRQLGSAPNKKTALTVAVLERVLRKIPEDLAGIRDRALLLVGFAGALRRSELVALDAADVTRHPKGLVVRVRKSKTDQAGEGMIKAIPHGKRLKVIPALDAWMVAAKITTGPLFRQARGSKVGPDRLRDQQVARIIKSRLRKAGLDSRSFSGHSLRSGFITSAAEAGASLQSIADVAGHARLDTTRGYMQISDAFREHAGRKFL